ncbi:cytochrome c family protein [Nioella sp. MMSF_3534]|jgi:cytochrome c|uniref:c-type cytochrome n=1 Tax=Nioella sp. MMSF_3534 TaxID=3046720 RepID=UPI00273EA91E|nr:c-type cytochrome [Nioella sp. MMSF_3534]
MIRKLTLAAALLSAPMAFADSHGAGPSGDAEAGENLFNRNCVSCHVVRDADDNVLAGRNGRTGPNLYGIVGAVAGSVEGFRYSSLMEAAHAAEITWDEASFAAYIPNATAFLTEATGERGRSTMTPQRVDEEGAIDIYAFLAQFGEMMEDEASD